MSGSKTHSVSIGSGWELKITYSFVSM
jgi:hypothetical protein